MVAFDNLASFQNIHEVTLQGLAQWLPYADTARVPGGKVFYDTSNFTGTENDWDSISIVFVPVGQKVLHVDHERFTQDPEMEARRLGYRIAGRLNNTKVLTGPTPKVVAEAALHDTEVSRLAQAGKLSLSTGFDAQITPSGHMIGKVRPSHILAFVRCGEGMTGHCGVPNDTAAAFNNAVEEVPDSTVEWAIKETNRLRAEREAREFEGANSPRQRQADMIAARGTYNPITHRFEGGKDLE
jgi:hypothetical protein